MTLEEIRTWLVAHVAAQLLLEVDDVDRNLPLGDLGLSSQQMIGISADLERLLQKPLGAQLLYNYPTIEALARYLAAGRDGSEQAVPSRQRSEPVAIVGIGCRFPGAGAGPKAFFDFLCGAGDAIVEVPPERWDVESIYDPDAMAAGKTCARWGGFLDRIDTFDHGAFSIGPGEAAEMDPQQRLLLEAAWHAMEDSGLTTSALAGSQTGVFIGISQNEYARGRFDDPAAIGAATPAANAVSIAANRISYVFDLQGPSLAVDTACSSSLTAIHLACESLRNGESTLALAGGVNALLSPDISIAFARAGLMSPDGRCKSFDDRADGYVRGEGVGIVVLKMLSDALRDGDEIYAQILGSAVRQDGRSNGLMAPRGCAQEAVIASACANAGVTPGELDSIEAHGTGTALGDVIESMALGNTVGRRVPGRDPCVIGSVKSNIGHLESAAGVAGLIKMALCLQNATYVPSLHFETPNRAVAFGMLNLEVAVKTTAWPRAGERRMAGVSSFGFGGTNVHVVMAERPAIRDAAQPVVELSFPLALAAHDGDSLRELASSYAREFDKATPAQGRLLVSGAARRSPHRERLAVTAKTPKAMAAALRRFASGKADRDVTIGTTRPNRGFAFVFSGQGAIWPGVGRDLFERNAVYRSAVLQCDDLLREHTGRSVLPAMFSDDSEALLACTEWAQPALFAVQMGLVAVLGSWGVIARASVGHSVGEVAAACVSGRLTLAQATRLIALRGNAMRHSRALGKMASLLASPAQVETLIAPFGDRLCIAAVNSGKSVVISGDSAAVDAAIVEANTDGITSLFLPVDYAFHSSQMDEPSIRLSLELGVFEGSDGTIPFYSTVRGRSFADGALDAPYWSENVRSPVLFRDAISSMIADGIDEFVEIGPSPVLLNDIQALLAEQDAQGRVAATLRRRHDCVSALNETAAQAFAAGALPSLAAMAQRERYALGAPPYAWVRRSRCWRDVPVASAAWRGQTGGQDEGALPAAIGRIRSQETGLKLEGIDGAFFVPSWERLLPGSAAACDVESPNKVWLVFVGENRLSAELVHALRARNLNVLTVAAGEAFATVEGGYVVSPGRSDHFENLMASLAARGISPDGIVYLWSLLANSPALAELESGLDLSFFGLLNIVHALGEAYTDRPLRLTAVSADTQDVLGGEPVLPLGVTALGPCLALAKEWPRLDSRFVDVRLEDAVSDASVGLADRLATDILSSESHPLVAYRGNSRWAPVLLPVAIAPTDPRRSVLRPHGVYLITGGLGDLGLIVAGNLWRTVGARLILVSRTVPREFDGASTAQDDARQSGIARRIRELEAEGAEIMVAAADISDSGAMRKIVDAGRARFGAVHGVIHAAGVTGTGHTLSKTRAQMLQVLRPKITGSLVLEELFDANELDVLVLFSSVSSLSGRVGLADYGAANAFLDGLGRRSGSSIARRTIVINWDTWGESGMAANLAVPDGLLALKKTLLRAGLRDAEGEEAFARILCCDFNHVLVKKGGLGSTAATAPAAKSVAGGTERQPRPELDVAYVAPATEFERTLAALVAEVLNLETIGMEDNFFDLGGHSLLATQAIARIRATFGVSLPLRTLFESPTVQALMVHIPEREWEEVSI